MALRIAVDIGGTFTDLVAVNSDTGKVFVTKTLSTPDDFARGVIDAIDLLPVEGKQGSIDSLIHGTTVVINAVINERGPKTGMLTTRGFRDVLLIGRQDRLERDLYNLRRTPQPTLISRENIFEIDERIGARGEVIRDLDEKGVATALRKFQSEGGQAVAVCFLHSYRNDAHERRCIDIAKRVTPDLEVSRSSEIDPGYREFERFSTTSVNAYGVPVVKEYLRRLEDALSSKGITAPLAIFTSNGGMMVADEAKRHPVRLVESGPAGGALGSAALAAQKQVADVIVFDMGGTTAKSALIVDGEIVRTANHLVAEKFPIRIPMVDQIEIGAGGGSIAWVDSGGLLRVGPRSAGAQPGPVCYGRGGTEPTLTDALLVLGFLNPAGLAGESLDLDYEAAKRAIQEKIAEPLGMAVADAATGIVRVVLAATTRMVRKSTVERGYDPRRFTLIGFGGAGPLIAGMLASELDVSTVVIPALAGVFSAAGMVNSDYSLEDSFSVIAPLDDVEWDKVNETIRTRVGRARERLVKSGLKENVVEATLQLEFRYQGQGFELPVNAPSIAVRSADLPSLKNAFHEQHHRLFGFDQKQTPIELINVRLSVTGRNKRAEMVGDTIRQKNGGDALAKRSVHWSGRHQQWPVYSIDRMPADVVKGPLLVDRDTTTVVVPPEFQAQVDEFSNIVIVRVVDASDRRGRADANDMSSVAHYSAIAHD